MPVAEVLLHRGVFTAGKQHHHGDAAGVDQWYPAQGARKFVYIICHLAVYVILGTALRRASAVPSWAAWCIVASSPLLVAAFVLPDGLGRMPLAVAGLSVAILILGSLPAAREVLRPATPGARS